jgi:hypothetical protein
MESRCDEIIVQVVVRTYDESGRPVREVVSPQVKVWRATTPDIWPLVDAVVKEMPPV